MAKVLMKGNEALGEAAIRAGCVHFFGYPITPQTESYLAGHSQPTRPFRFVLPICPGVSPLHNYCHYSLDG